MLFVPHLLIILLKWTLLMYGGPAYIQNVINNVIILARYYFFYADGVKINSVQLTNFD